MATKTTLVSYESRVAGIQEVRQNISVEINMLKINSIF